MDWKKPLLAISLAVAALPGLAQTTVTIVHTNDLHARVQPAVRNNVALGGYSRLTTAINQIRQEAPEMLLLDAGDVFQGTLFFNVYDGLADLAFMHRAGYRAMAIGNHEFDRGPAVLGAFARLAKFPLLSANIDVSQEPELRDVVLPSTFVLVSGEKIGIVGCTTPTLPTISNIGPNVKMKDIVSSVQQEVDRLKAEGIDKIIVLSHSGFSTDVANAGRWRDVDLIIGGHSHTFLGDLLVPGATSSGSYPTMVKDVTGKEIPIVQAWEWGKVLGRIELTFDDNGVVTNVKGSPIAIDATITPDSTMESLIAAFNKPIEALVSQRIGSTEATLTRSRTATSDSLMGNVIADAMLAATTQEGVVAGFMNAGGVRSEIEAGTVTFGRAVEVQPFNNTLVVLDLTGTELRSALEHGVRTLPDFSGAFLIPSRGTSYEVDPSLPVGRRVTKVTIAGEPLNDRLTYRVVFNSFTSGGGDAHEVLRDAKGTRRDLGTFDIDALVTYFRANNPLKTPDSRRVMIRTISGGR
ncbi:MAG: bifunctional metallophosphatase/5'-nucleotidase [Fimbriimonadaceae bacterium]|jgi:5'-nucleotidase|nr:bifunctional metallophosphatase/5'-nucleotidase [Fimbriimonadaceae bacterium]